MGHGLKNIARAAETAWILVDGDGFCQLASPLACDWLGKKPEALCGGTPEALLGLDGPVEVLLKRDVVYTLRLAVGEVSITVEPLPRGAMLWLQRVDASFDPALIDLPFETIFSHAAVGLARLALDGSLLEANAEFCNLIGYSRTAISHLNYHDFIVGVDENGLWSDLDRLLSNGESSFSCERLCRCRDYSEVWVDLGISLVRDTAERPACFVLVVKDIERLKEAESEARFLALYDSLTGLPNRRMLEDRVNQAIAHAEREALEVALLFLDLDRFKDINDVFGHHSGDQLLIEVSRRLSNCVRKVDTVARLGGDEFVVVLVGQEGGNSAGAVAEKILQAMAEPFELDGKQVYSGTSIGISRYPEDARDSDSLLKYADAAMYQVKEEGRGTFRYYSSKLNRSIQEKLIFDNSMREALKQGQFFIEYQPQVELQSGRMFGVEALVRWRHPDFGVIMPGQFIARAEDNGTIAALGRWVLDEACQQVALWRGKGLTDLSLTVNISGRQFRLSDVADDVDHALERSGLPASCLEIELTETVLMERCSSIIEGLLDLRVRGTRLALDDFGTGFSSLSYLKKFPVDCVKIDRSFIQSLACAGDRAPIAESIISMAHNLGIKVFGEGVETDVQRYFLLSRGCDEGQGFFFSPPLGGEVLEQFCFARETLQEQGVFFPSDWRQAENRRANLHP